MKVGFSTSYIFLAAIYLFSVSLVFPENLRNISIILLAFYSLFIIIKAKDLKPLLNVKTAINVCLFFVLVASLIYTKNIDYGLKKLTLLSSLLIFPFAFSLYNNNGGNKLMEKHIHRIYLCYYISTLGFFVGLFIYNYVNGYVNEFIFKNYSERLNSKLGKYSLHPIYASMYIGVAVLLSFKIYEKLNRVGSKILIIIGNIFLFLTIALLARKSVFALLVLMCAFVFFTKQKKKEIFLYLIFITALFYISFQIPALKIRYLEFFNTFFNNSNSQIGSTFYRLNIYKCGIDSIFVSPWFGYGLGDTKSVLIECYNTKMEVFNGQYFNSHNQYISVWLSSGILGFLSLVSMMVYNIKLMIRNSFIIETLILLLLTITMMIENILERQSGVILFSFFINFFAFLIPQKRNIN